MKNENDMTKIQSQQQNKGICVSILFYFYFQENNNSVILMFPVHQPTNKVDQYHEQYFVWMTSVVYWITRP